MNEKYVNMPLWEKAIYAGLMAGTMVLAGRALYNRIVPSRQQVQPSAVEEIIQELEEEKGVPDSSPAKPYNGKDEENPEPIPEEIPGDNADYTIEDFSRGLEETNNLLEKKLQEADGFMQEIDKIRELLREEDGSYPAPKAPPLAPPSKGLNPKYKPGNEPSPTKPAPKIRYRRFSPRAQSC